MRYSRKAFWISLAAFVGFFALLTWFDPGKDHLTVLVGPVLGFAGTGRLHDLGRSSVWILVPLLLSIAVGVALDIAGIRYPLNWDIGLGVGFAMVAVLGLFPGQPGANRYGEPRARRYA